VRRNAIQILGAVCWRTWLKTARRPVVLTFSFVQPIMWILFFGFLFQRFNVGLVLHGVRYLDFLVPGVCAMTVLFGASQSGIGLIRDM
jgi:ABC-2 type transport system permease protein